MSVSCHTHQTVPVVPGKGRPLQEAERDEAYRAQHCVEPQPARSGMVQGAGGAAWGEAGLAGVKLDCAFATMHAAQAASA